MQYVVLLFKLGSSLRADSIGSGQASGARVSLLVGLENFIFMHARTHARRQKKNFFSHTYVRCCAVGRGVYSVAALLVGVCFCFVCLNAFTSLVFFFILVLLSRL